MDESLEKVLAEIKKRVLVLDGENPVLSIQDAIRLAERNKLIYRWAQNGDYYQLRWTEEHTAITVHANEVCAQIYKRVMLMVPEATLPNDNNKLATPEEIYATTGEPDPAKHKTYTNKEAAAQAEKSPKTGGSKSRAKKNLKSS